MEMVADVISASTVQRFWAKVDLSEATECWLWIGAKGPNGYGRFGAGRRIDGPGYRTVYPHRFAYELTCWSRT